MQHPALFEVRLEAPSIKCLLCFMLAFGGFFGAGSAWAIELAGLTVTPHIQSSEMRYRRPPDPQLGARVEMFLVHRGETPLKISPDFSMHFDGKTPMDLVAKGEWAWHDTPSARGGEELSLPQGCMTVWSFNSKTNAWGVGTQHTLETPDLVNQSLRLAAPQAWLSAVTFLGTQGEIAPNRTVVHVVNNSSRPLTLRACRLWTPMRQSDFRVLHPGAWSSDLKLFPTSGIIPAGEKGGFSLESAALPLTYAAVEVQVQHSEESPVSLWAHLRIKREVVDLGGGWVASALGARNSLQIEPYLQTLRRMHLSTGMHQHTPGYSDTPLFDKYPLKYMNRLEPLQDYDVDAMLLRVHAVEFLGEPQHGGGRPVPPQKVLEAFLPYGATRLPTAVTHSEERIWRYYAGLSDYPHYDAYRVCAPAPDAWGLYDRWGGERLRWGAPLETIGAMTRSLRELNRPRPIAYWSQGAHDGWGGPLGFAGRQRTSPTPDELRSQAYQGVAQRITSLYWFNLSLKSLLKFRDLIDPITRVNREILMLEDLLLEGDAYEYRRQLVDGRPAWDLSSIAGPNGAIFFVNDLGYVPDLQEKVFRFSPREGEFRFKLPPHLDAPLEIFRLDADGLHDVSAKAEANQLVIHDTVKVVGVYIAAPSPRLRERLLARHRELVTQEKALNFDPAARDEDFAVLRELMP